MRGLLHLAERNQPHLVPLPHLLERHRTRMSRASPCPSSGELSKAVMVGVIDSSSRLGKRTANSTQSGHSLASLKANNIAATDGDRSVAIGVVHLPALEAGGCMQQLDGGLVLESNR